MASCQSRMPDPRALEVSCVIESDKSLPHFGSVTRSFSRSATDDEYDCRKTDMRHHDGDAIRIRWRGISGIMC